MFLFPRPKAKAASAAGPSNVKNVATKSEAKAPVATAKGKVKEPPKKGKEAKQTPKGQQDAKARAQALDKAAKTKRVEGLSDPEKVLASIQDNLYTLRNTRSAEQQNLVFPILNETTRAGTCILHINL